MLARSKDFMLQDPGPQASRARSRLRTVQLGAAWLVFRPHHVELSGWLLRQHTVGSGQHWHAEGFW